jgi:hypothetical protein
MPSCLPVKIIDAKFNVITYSRTEQAGPGRRAPGPYKPLIVTERSIIISSSSTFYDT